MTQTAISRWKSALYLLAGAGGLVGSVWLLARAVGAERTARGWAFFFALQLCLLWLPLLALSALRCASRGLVEASLLWLGVFLAALGGQLIAGHSLTQTAWAMGMVAAVTFLILSCAHVVARLSTVEIGRASGAGLTFFLISTPFWTGALWTTVSPLMSGGSAWQSVLKQALVWLCPGACLSIAFPANQVELLPTMYRIWFGPLTPYPAHPAIFIGGYAGLGCVFALVSWVLVESPAVGDAAPSSQPT